MRERTCQILVVDDDDDLRSSLVDVLSSRWSACEAHGGEEAISWLSGCEELPALVLLDVNMPALSGPEVVLAMRQAPRTAAIPVILMSAREDLAELAAGLGVQGHARKPFDLDALLRLIARVLG